MVTLRGAELCPCHSTGSSSSTQPHRLRLDVTNGSASGGLVLAASSAVIPTARCGTCIRHRLGGVLEQTRVHAREMSSKPGAMAAEPDVRGHSRLRSEEHTSELQS